MNDPKDTAANPFNSPAVAERVERHSAGTQVIRAGETASSALAAQSKAMVESRYVMALKNPRNMDQVRQDLLKECRRPSFAHNKSALYRKPIGAGVEGLGIRFVEVALRCMRNVLSESIMVYSDEEKEVHRVIVTDLENNNTWPMDVVVNKTVERSKPMDDGYYISARKNSYGKMVYTVPATEDDLLNKRLAAISKAMRTAGLRIIPGDLQDEAEAIIRAIRLDAAAKDPDAERKSIADGFFQLNIRASDLEEYLGHGLDVCTPAELVDLRGLYGALRDGEATWKTVMDNKRASAETPPSGDGAGAGEKKQPETSAGKLKAAVTSANKGASSAEKKSEAADATTTGKPQATQEPAAGAATSASAGESSAPKAGNEPARTNAEADQEVTVLDAIAQLPEFSTIENMTSYADTLPETIKTDRRFEHAFKSRMEALKKPQKKL